MGADILGGGAPAAAPPSTNALLGDIFGLGNAASTTFYIPPKQEWISAAKGKGLEISGTFSRKNATIYMDMTFSNKVMQPLSNFGIQFNKNSFGLTPAQPLNVPAIPPNQSVDVFTVAKRTLEGQDMVYQSIKFTNNVWALAELKIQPGNPNITLAVKSRALDVAQGINQVYDAILHS